MRVAAHAHARLVDLEDAALQVVEVDHVDDVLEQLAIAGLRHRQPLAGLALGLEQPRVLDGDAGLPGDTLDEPELLAQEVVVGAGPRHREAADDLALDHHGHGEHRLVRQHAEQRMVEARIGLTVAGKDRSREIGRLPHRPLVHRHRCGRKEGLQVGRHVIAGHRDEVAAALVPSPHAAHLCAEGAHHLPDRAAPDLGHVEDRPGRLAHHEQRLGLAQALLRLLPQPRVPDGHRG